MTFLRLYFYFIVICFIVSLLVYKNNRFRYLRLFPPFLLATIIAEFSGSYLGYLDKNNSYIYNFFSVIEFYFYMHLISLIITNNKAKLVIRISGFIYALVAVINIVFFQGMNVFHTVTYSLGCLMIVAACIYFFLELFRLPESVKLSRNPGFWICSGLLFFYCCGFPLYAFINFWVGVKWMRNSFEGIFDILNIFLYSLFIIAFLCHRNRNYTSSPS